MGRPTLLTPAVQEAIVKSVRNGNYLEPSAIAAGVSYSAALAWMRQGDGTHPTLEPDEKTTEFYEAVSVAEAEQELETVEVLSHNNDWRARSRMLEGRHPDRWAPKVEPEPDASTQTLSLLQALIASRNANNRPPTIVEAAVSNNQPALIEATTIEVEESDSSE